MRDSSILKLRLGNFKTRFFRSSSRLTDILKTSMNIQKKKWAGLRKLLELLKNTQIRKLMKWENKYCLPKRSKESGESRLKICKLKRCLKFTQLLNFSTKTLRKLPETQKIGMTSYQRKVRMLFTTLSNNQQTSRRKSMLRTQLQKTEFDYR